MYRFASLGSGSKGNATVVQTKSTTVLVDCGFGIKESNLRLAELNLSLAQIDAILITHEHADHIKGVGAVSRKYNIPVYMTEGTFQARSYGAIPSLHLICHYEPFSIHDLHVQPVPVPHDAAEPAQFILTSQALRLGVLTDLGQITPYILEKYANCDALLIEANHDLQMLA